MDILTFFFFVVLKLLICFRTRLGGPCVKTYPVECGDLLRRARVAFQAGRTFKESFRLAQLQAVMQMLEEHEGDFVDALGRDLHKVSVYVSCDCSSLTFRTIVSVIMSQIVFFFLTFFFNLPIFIIFFNQPRFETIVSELVLVKNEALHAINNLKKWMQPQHVERNLVRLFYVYYGPFSKNKLIISLLLFMTLHNLFGKNILSCCYKEMYCAEPAKADYNAALLLLQE